MGRAAPLQPPQLTEARTCLGAFELLDTAGLEDVTRVGGEARPPPVSREEWGTFFNSQGVRRALALDALMRNGGLLRS